MKSTVNVTPTILKLVAHRLGVDGVHGSSGVAVIASALRAEVCPTKYTGVSDKEIILSYFRSLGLDPTPPKQKPGYAKQAAARRERETRPFITYPADPDTQFYVYTEGGPLPWD